MLDTQSVQLANPKVGLGELYCPVCKEATKPFWSGLVDPITGDGFSMNRCRRCGLGLTAPVPANLDKYYPPVYYGARHGFTASWCIRRRLKFLSTLLGSDRGKLLDVGCGEGDFLQAAAREGWRVVGTERDPRRINGGFPVYASVPDTAAQGPFNCITIWHVLEHVLDPLQCLTEIRDQLAPGGILFVAVPDFGGWQAQCFRQAWLHLDVPRHLFHFDKPSLARVLDQAGLEVVASWHQEIEYDWLGWIQSAQNALFSRMNILFDALTGKPQRASSLQLTAAYFLAAIFAMPSLALTLLSTAFKRGGTLVVAAKPK